MNKSYPTARRDRDGLAVIGRTKRDLMGIRFLDDDETGPPSTVDTEAAGVADALNSDETVNQLAGATARIAELEAELATVQATLTKVQAHNYTLLTESPAAGTTDTTADNSTLADDDGPVDIDDLFD